MPQKPLLDRLSFVDFVIVHNHEDIRILIGRVGSVNDLEQINEQAAGFAKPDAVQHTACDYIKSSGQIVLLICTRRADFKLAAFLHPLIANFWQQVDVEFISKQ